MLGARPQYLVLTDTDQHNIQAAPGAGKAIEVLHIFASSDQAAQTTLSIKENTTTKYSLVLQISSQPVPVALGESGWLLPENTALTAQHSVDTANVYVTALTRVVPSQVLQS